MLSTEAFSYSVNLDYIVTQICFIGGIVTCNTSRFPCIWLYLMSRAKLTVHNRIRYAVNLLSSYPRNTFPLDLVSGRPSVNHIFQVTHLISLPCRPTSLREPKESFMQPTAPSNAPTYCTKPSEL
jgi:hypothetical protein